MLLSDIIVIVSVIAMDIYGFYMLRKVDREINKFALMRVALVDTVQKEFNIIKEDAFGLFAKYEDKIAELFGGILDTKEEIDNTIQAAQGYMQPAVAVEIGEAIILKTLETMAMTDLKELGEKHRTVKNAKIGLQVVGNNVAKGAGVNEILEQFAPVAEKLQAGGNFMEQYQDNPLVQIGMAMFGGNFGGGDASQAAPMKNVTPKGQPPRELTK